MKPISCLQNGNEDLRRFLYVNSTPDTSTGSTEAPLTGPGNDEDEPSYLQNAGTRLKVKKILNDKDKDISLTEISRRLTMMRDLKRDGDLNELRKKIREWYKNNTKYTNIVESGSDEDMYTLVNKIRDDEMARFNGLCSSSAHSFTHALSALKTGHGSALNTETGDILKKMNIDTGKNSAIKYLEVSRQKSALEAKLEAKKLSLVHLERELSQHKASQAQITEQKNKWERNKWSWLSLGVKGTAILSSLAVFGGVVQGLTSPLWKLYAPFSNAPAWGALSIVMSCVPYLVTPLAGASVVAAGTAGLAYDKIRLRSRLLQAGHDRKERKFKKEIEREKKAQGIPELENDIREAEKTLEKYRDENASRVTVLEKQKAKWETALQADNLTPANQTEIGNNIQHLNTLITLFRVSEDNNGDKITAPGTVSSDYIIENLRKMGIDQDEDMFSKFERLAKEEDSDTVTIQEKLKTISRSGDVEKEVQKLNAYERKAPKAYLKSLDESDYSSVLASSSFARKAPLFLKAIKSIHSLPANNVWRISISYALYQMLNDKEVEEEKAERKKIREEFKKIPGEDLKSHIKHNPNILHTLSLSNGKSAPKIASATTFDDYLSKLDISGLKKVLYAFEHILDTGNPYILDASENKLKPEKEVLKTQIENLYSTSLESINDGDKAKTYLENKNNTEILALLNGIPSLTDEEKLTSIPSCGTATSDKFIARINAENNVKNLRKLKVIFEKIVRGCKYDDTSKKFEAN